jgi:hypothetical protein
MSSKQYSCSVHQRKTSRLKPDSAVIVRVKAHVCTRLVCKHRVAWDVRPTLPLRTLTEKTWLLIEIITKTRDYNWTVPCSLAVSQVGTCSLAVSHVGTWSLAVSHVGTCSLAVSHVGTWSLAVSHVGTLKALEEYSQGIRSCESTPLANSCRKERKADWS